MQIMLKILRSPWSKRLVFTAFLLYLVLTWSTILDRANQVDRMMGGKVPMWDDWNYQVLAVNLLHGYGFSDYFYLPDEAYYLVDSPHDIAKTDGYSFFRAPGLPLLLAGTYALYGESTLYARLMLAAIIWLTALLLLFTGFAMPGWAGLIAGGLAAYYYLNAGGGVVGPEGFFDGRILTEPATAFGISLTAFLMTLYLQRRHPVHLYFTGISLMIVVFTRASFMLVIPMFYAYLYFTQHKLNQLAIFIAITSIPIISWSVYASLQSGQLVLFTTQGEDDFAEFNNMDVITGIGPERINQGGWQPGFALGDNGELIWTQHNVAQPGENGWLKGLRFWINNPEKLPELFYFKLRACFWYEDTTDLKYPDGRIYLFGIGMLLLSLGLRTPAQMKPRSRRISLWNLTDNQTLLFQLFLVTIILVGGNALPFYVILIIWLVVLGIAILRPYGNAWKPPGPLPRWFLIFLASYLITTLLFGGYSRFHYPLDPTLMLFGIMGLITTIIELAKKNTWLRPGNLVTSSIK